MAGSAARAAGGVVDPAIYTGTRASRPTRAA